MGFFSNKKKQPKKSKAQPQSQPAEPSNTSPELELVDPKEDRFNIQPYPGQDPLIERIKSQAHEGHFNPGAIVETQRQQLKSVHIDKNNHNPDPGSPEAEFKKIAREISKTFNNNNSGSSNTSHASRPSGGATNSYSNLLKKTDSSLSGRRKESTKIPEFAKSNLLKKTESNTSAPRKENTPEFAKIARQLSKTSANSFKSNHTAKSNTKSVSSTEDYSNVKNALRKVSSEKKHSTTSSSTSSYGFTAAKLSSSSYAEIKYPTKTKTTVASASSSVSYTEIRSKLRNVKKPTVQKLPAVGGIVMPNMPKEDYTVARSKLKAVCRPSMVQPQVDSDLMSESDGDDDDDKVTNNNNNNKTLSERTDDEIIEEIKQQIKPSLQRFIADEIQHQLVQLEKADLLIPPPPSDDPDDPPPPSDDLGSPVHSSPSSYVKPAPPPLSDDGDTSDDEDEAAEEASTVSSADEENKLAVAEAEDGCVIELEDDCTSEYPIDAHTLNSKVQLEQFMDDDEATSTFSFEMDHLPSGNNDNDENNQAASNLPTFGDNLYTSPMPSGDMLPPGMSGKDAKAFSKRSGNNFVGVANPMLRQQSSGDPNNKSAKPSKLVALKTKFKAIKGVLNASSSSKKRVSRAKLSL